MKLEKIYIAGPMRGKPFYNFDAFFDAERNLTEQGWHVLNPARMDIENGFNAYTLPASGDFTGIPHGFDLDACLRRDVDAIFEADAIYMLRGWKESTGAKAERALAEWRHIAILEEK